MPRNRVDAEPKTGVAAWNESAGIRSRSQAGSSGRRNKAQADKRKRVAALVVLAIVCVACVVCAWPIKERIARGLWLKEGVAYTFDVSGEDGAASPESVSAAISAVQGRLAASGVSEYAVGQKGDNSFSVSLPSSIDGERLAKLVGGPGKVEFVRMDEIGDADALTMVNAGTEDVQLGEGTYTSFLDGSAVATSDVVDAGYGSYAVHIKFTEEGAKKFSEVTKELAEDMGRIAIVIDGRVYSAPSVSQQIDGGEVYISGDFSREEANALKAALGGDALSVATTYKGSEKIGPLVGKGMLWGMVGVAVAAFAGVTVFSFVRFKKLAVLPIGTMAVFAAIVLGLMAVLSRANMFVLTIPCVLGGAWAAATTVLAIDLVTSRFLEKVANGHSVKGSATSAPLEALRPLGIPCVVAFVIALVLLFVPMPALHDFGLSVVLGMVAGVMAIGWYALTMLRLLASGAIQEDPTAWGAQPLPAKTTSEASES